MLVAPPGRVLGGPVWTGAAGPAGAPTAAGPAEPAEPAGAGADDADDEDTPAPRWLALGMASQAGRDEASGTTAAMAISTAIARRHEIRAGRADLSIGTKTIGDRFRLRGIRADPAAAGPRSRYTSPSSSRPSSRAYPSFRPTSMPEARIASRVSKRSTRDSASIRVRPSPRSSKDSVSRDTPSGMPSQVKVCTRRSSRTVWKQPRKPYSSPFTTFR